MILNIFLIPTQPNQNKTKQNKPNQTKQKPKQQTG